MTRLTVAGIALGAVVAALVLLLGGGRTPGRGGFVADMQCANKSFVLIGAPHTQAVEDAGDQRILGAIDQATAVAVEIDVNGLDLNLVAAAYSQPVHRLDSLTPTAVSLVQAAMTHRGLSVEGQGNFLSKSGLLALHWLEADPQARPAGELAPGYDQLAIAHAKEAGLRLIEIEPFQDFRRHEDGMSRAQLESLLTRTAQLTLDGDAAGLWQRFYAELRDGLAKNDINLYRTRYLDGLKRELGIPEAYGDVYLTARNPFFHERLRQEIEKQATHDRLVVVVGAAHLGGSDGLVARFVGDGCSAQVRP